MRTAGIHVSGLVYSFILAIVLSSCGGQVKQADALISENGKPAGIIVEYSSPIENNSVNKETFQVSGLEIRNLFVSNVNHFREKSGEQLAGGGRFVIIFLNQKADSSAPVEIVGNNEIPNLDLRIKQVAPVTTLSGKVIKPWKKSIKTKDRFIVGESFLR